MKAIKKKVALALAMTAIVTSMVGCTGNKAETATTSDLSELTITHVTSPLNVPSIIQKIREYLHKNSVKMVRILKLNMLK